MNSIHHDDIGYAHVCLDKDTQNGEVLVDFIQFCQEHPELRFWQALTRWGGFCMIYAMKLQKKTDTTGDYWEEGPHKDTFYWEGRNE